MTEDTVVALRHPEATADALTEALRAGARELLAQAIEAEVAAVRVAHEYLKTEDGRRRLVRHGHGPDRAILTGIGPVSVRRPKVRDRGCVARYPCRRKRTAVSRWQMVHVPCKAGFAEAGWIRDG